MGYITTEINQRDNVIDAFEKRMIRFPQVIMPLKHIFTPGLYAREIHCKAGTLLTSMVHKYEHPFVLSKGKLKIFDEEVIELEAPYTGITKAGARRLVYIVEDVIWTTFHVTDKKTVEEVEKDILVPYVNSSVDQEKMDAVRLQIISDYVVLGQEPDICLG